MVTKARKANGQFVKGGKRKVASKSSSRRRGRGGMTFPIAVAAGFMPYVGATVGAVKTAGWQNGLSTSSKFLTGFDPVTRTWSAGYLWQGLIPALLGVVAHRVIGGGLGLNRILARARVPFIRF